jgi:uncharacterized membrane protein YebE (DUF533 family)
VTSPRKHATASAAGEACDVIRLLSRAVADGVIDVRERAELLPEVRQAVAALLELEQALTREPKP